MDDARADITRLLLDHQRGDREAFDRLIPLVYPDLRRLARSRLRGSPPGHTLDTSAVVHEAYLRLVDQRQMSWNDRTHFFRIAARVMRRMARDAAPKK